LGIKSDTIQNTNLKEQW